VQGRGARAITCSDFRDYTAGGVRNQCRTTNSSGADYKALYAKLRANWTPPIAPMLQPDQYLVVRFHLNRDGRLSAPVEVLNGSGPLYQPAVEAAKRAVERSQPFDMFSPSTYDLWETVQVNFEPRYVFSPPPARVK
jgi:hypothetical protein